MNSNTITNDDVIFFMDMVNSTKSPNHVPKYYRPKPYYKILDDKDSPEFQRFIKVYQSEKHVLQEREQQILDDLYGVIKPRATLQETNIPHNITRERVRQIRHRAELRMVRSLMKKWKKPVK